MSIHIEGLRINQQRSLIGEELNEQKQALKGLVSAMRAQIVQHGVDVELINGVPREARRYAVFLKVPGRDAVLVINSNGLIENEKDFGLTISVTSKISQGDTVKIDPILSFQTPNARGLVSEKDAIYLSGYTPKQLSDLAMLIETGEPISREAYKAFFQKK